MRRHLMSMCHIIALYGYIDDDRASMLLNVRGFLAHKGKRSAPRPRRRRSL